MNKIARLSLGGIAIGLLALSGWKAYPRLRPPEAAGAQQLWQCPMRCLHKTYDHPGTCPVCHMKLVPAGQPQGKLVGYRCPLHYSQVLFDKPGRCPFCTLDLKAVYEGGPHPAKHAAIAAWPSVGDKMAVYFRPYQVRKVQIDRLLRVAGSVSKDGRHLSAQLPVGAEAPLKGATAMIMPAVGYARPALGSVEGSAKGRLSIRVPNAIGGFAQVTAEIRLPGPAVLAVPFEAVDESGKGAQVYVRSGAGGEETYEPRRVKLGRRGENFVEVLEGLKEGESVAGSGVFWLDAQWRMDHPEAEAAL